MKRNLLIIPILILCSCSDLLYVEVPSTQLTTTTVFSNEIHANTALIGLIVSINSNGNSSYRIPFMTGIYSDEFKNYSSDNSIVQMYQNVMQPLDAYSNSFWNNAYNWIYQANSIIEGCENSNSLTNSTKNFIIAEAKLIRAFYYLYLVNFYGEVPLILSTDYATNSKASKAPIAEIYERIITDLLFSADNLRLEYVDGNGNNVAINRVRPNKYAAESLLARTYAYMKNWDKALIHSSNVIAQNSLYGLEPIDKVFLKNSKEAIWQMEKISPTTLGTHEGQNFQLTNRPLTITTNCISLSPSILNSFDVEDLRLKHWVGVTEDKSVIPSRFYSYPNKFKDRSTTNPLEYSIPLRLAEQVLIRSEAYANLGQLERAIDDLNTVRIRSGLPPYIGNLDFLEVQSAILDEREHEFFAEWGHRFIDLKRSDRLDEAMNDEFVKIDKGNNWDSNYAYWPIPQREIDLNKNLVQNLGYN